MASLRAGAPLQCSETSSVIAKIEDLYPTETEAACFAERSTATLYAGSPALLIEGAVDREHPEERGRVPNVVEGDAGETAAPAESKARTAQDCQELVATVLAASEALVGQLPYAVNRMCSIWLGKNFLEFHLNNMNNVPLFQVHNASNMWQVRAISKKT